MRPPIGQSLVVRVGERFGRWTVVAPTTNHPINGKTRAVVRCECGFEGVRIYSSLLSGHSLQCWPCGKRQATKTRLEAKPQINLYAKCSRRLGHERRCRRRYYEHVDGVCPEANGRPDRTFLPYGYGPYAVRATQSFSVEEVEAFNLLLKGWLRRTLADVPTPLVASLSRKVMAMKSTIERKKQEGEAAE